MNRCRVRMIGHVFVMALVTMTMHPRRGHCGERPSPPRYTLFASGDTSLARWAPYEVYRQGASSVLSDVHDLTVTADIALTNLECVVSSVGDYFDKGERRPFLYRAPPDMLDVLTHAGFDVAVVGNNHSVDYGPNALMDQLALLEATGIAAVGAGANAREAAKPVYVQIDDVIVAFIGMETNFEKMGATKDRPGNHYAREYTPVFKAVQQVVQEATSHADLVVFSPHWGENWTDAPTEKRRRLARALIDIGVDAIIGHSSHLFHGIEIYRGRPIIYDMGSFYFDGKLPNRMRWGAGFVLEFDRNGFHRLIVHPLRLKSSRTERARGSDSRKIKTLMRTLSTDLDPDVEISEQGDTLVFDLAPPPQKPSRRTSAAERIHRTGQTKHLPDSLRNRLPNVVHTTPPTWTAGFAEVELNNGIRILGSRIANAVRPRTAFVADVALQVPGPIVDGHWEANLRGINQDTGETFHWIHPIADGNWIPLKWQKGQIVVDHSLARPPRMPEGIYDLSWRFEDRLSKRVARPVNPALGDEQGFVPVGTIAIRNTGIPKGPAGVAWPGGLDPPSTEGSAVTSELKTPISGRTLMGLLLIAVLAIAGIALVLRRNRRRPTR